MRVAIFSDVHGNSLALDAVLADAERLGVDAWWCLGDVAELGYDPAGSLQRVANLSHLTVVRGNADRLVVSVTEAPMFDALVEAGDDAAAAEENLAYARGAAWTAAAVQASGLLGWLVDLPLERHIVLPDGTRVLLVHAAPGRDDGPGIRPDDPDATVSERLAGVNADLVVVGHTHLPFERVVDGVRVWNPGSVSNPVTADWRAMWTLLEADGLGYTLTRQWVEYDITTMLSALERSQAPTQDKTRAFWVRGVDG